MSKYFLLILTSFLLTASIARAADECFTQAKNCSDVDIDAPKAEEAFRKGCEAKDWYSCARLGQLFEVRKHDLVKAVENYDLACKGKDAFGCTQAESLHQELCFFEGNKKFCDGREPKGEARIYLFLQAFETKYQDAFNGHSFDAPWSSKKAEALFKKRVKEKNRKLLRVLKAEKKTGRHDGADAEMLSYYLGCLKGKCPSFNEGWYE